MNKQAIVVGAGLAGCEAAWQLTRHGIQVELYEMKPQKKSPAVQPEDRRGHSEKRFDTADPVSFSVAGGGFCHQCRGKAPI